MIRFLFAVLALMISSFSASAQLNVELSTSDYNGYEVSCFGGHDGEITATPVNGTPPYSYLWSTGATTQTIDSLSADYYSVTVTDSDSVQIERGINLSSPEGLRAQLSSPTYSNGMNVSCFQCSNGSITSQLSGGVIPYSYLWENSAATPGRSGLGKGVYYLTVTDNNGCTDAEDITLTEPDREDWAVSGNTGSNPSSNYIGTADSNDFVMKTDNTERVRIKSNGEVVMPESTVLRLRKISSPDSLLYIGDSTMVFNHGQNNISAHSTSSNKGIGIGSGSAIGKGLYSVALGNLSTAAADYSVSIGRYTNVAPNATNSITIGSGTSNSTRLANGCGNAHKICHSAEGIH